MKLLLIATAFVLVAPTLAYSQYRGVAAADGSSYVAVESGSSLLEAEDNARDDCRSATNGRACKAISARRSNHFVVVKCGQYVHMGADNTTREARQVAKDNAGQYPGHVGCRDIYVD